MQKNLLAILAAAGASLFSVLSHAHVARDDAASKATMDDGARFGKIVLNDEIATTQPATQSNSLAETMRKLSPFQPGLKKKGKKMMRALKGKTMKRLKTKSSKKMMRRLK